MRSLMHWIGCLCFTFSLGVFAHEGHGVPGALPPAPHGGILKEADHVTGHMHAPNKEEVELFFEAVYKDKKLSVFALALEPSNTSTFKTLSAKTDLSGVTMKIENPRTKKTEVVKPVIGESIDLPYDAKGTNRFLIHLEVEHAKEKKKGKIQIESNA